MTIKSQTIKINWKKLLLATLICGFGMWILAGLWHNLVLPIFNNNIEPHHDGIGIMLISYFILSFFMSYLFIQLPESNNWRIKGFKLGIIVGILWVFPHGLTMAGAHDTSIIYEVKNMFWHMIEQGFGGIIIGFVYRNNSIE